MSNLTGGCACGAVRYELSEAPIYQLVCHCRDCQKASGSAFAEVLLVASDRVSLVGKEPKFFALKAESGRIMSRGFCEDCGSPIMIRRPETPQLTFLQAGSLDDPNLFEPAAEVFSSRAQPFVRPIEGAARFEKGPPAEVIRPILEAHFTHRG